MKTLPYELIYFREHKNYYSKVAPKVDSRWNAGTPKIRRHQAPKTKIVRRNSEMVLPTSFESMTQKEFEDECDNVFGKSPIKEEDLKDISSFNSSASTSMETVSDHFRQLFEQLEKYMETAPDFDCLFIRKRVSKMKSGMLNINQLFDDLLHTGNRLEKFLIERQRNNNL